ncbi:MAG TPA: DNA mismatch endonuclease Vsr [Terriglobia bacterium]|nr:DNA mismatch endonuclease Vsr [Terriglobia bacterium]
MDVFSSTQRSEIMRRVKSKDTQPEILVRKLIRSMGYRYSVNRKDLPGCPDLVFTKRKRVIFVHGCFWHQHSCGGAALPKSHRDYWMGKQARNAKRDRRNIRKLRRSGWKIVVVWECQTRSLDKLSGRLQRFMDQ